MIKYEAWLPSTIDLFNSFDFNGVCQMKIVAHLKLDKKDLAELRPPSHSLDR